MRILGAALPLLLVAACWAAAIPPSGEAKNENSTEPTQTAQDGNQAVPPAGQPAHPMLAYLNLRPMLPVKPTFFPPFVDPNVFADRKAALLSGLFGIPPPPAPAAPAPGSRPGPLFPYFVPGYFAAKKNSFLNALFAAQQQPVGQEPPPAQARRALPGFLPAAAGGPPPGLAFAPSVFAAKKEAFLHQLFAALNATAAPTTPAPLPSWLDFLDDSSSAAGQADTQAPLPRVSLAPTAAVSAGGPIDLSIYADKKTKFLNALFDSFGLPPPTPKPSIVPSGFWSPFAAPPGPVFPGPKPPGKSSPCPMCKTKMSSFLSKLIQQINATDASASEVSPKELREVREVVDSSEEDTTPTRRGLAGAAIGGPFGAGNPFVGGPFGVGKPFIGGPFGAGKPFIGGPFGVGKPFIGGPFGVGKPFGPAVDPQFFMDKKTTFLNQLIASKAVSPDGTGSDTGASPDSFSPYSPFAPAPKPTIVPPDFWNPFPTAAAAGPGAPAAKPTIVPPNFWSPFAAPNPAASATAGPVPAALFADKKAKFLSTLFAGLQTTPAPAALSEEQQSAVDEDDDEFDSFLQALVEALSTPNDLYLSRRSVGAGSGAAGAARQQLIDNAVTQMATLKNDIVGTVNEILAQKAAAEQQPAFPFAKSPYAAYGTMKKGGPPPGVMKKGPPPGVMKKGGPMAGKGGFPFWGGAAPTPDPTAELQQRLQVLSQAFDSLATLEKDASAALQASSTSVPAPAPIAPAASTGMDAATLLQLLRAASTAGDVGAKAPRKGKASRLTAPRSVQFAVRQGQFSLPPGAEELLTAGGGASPDEHEGGGLRLQIKVPTAS